MDDSKSKSKKIKKPEFFDYLKNMFKIYINYLDVISGKKRNAVRNKALMFELFAVLRENNLLKYDYLDFVDEELSRIYNFCNIVLIEGQNGVDKILKAGGWKVLNKFEKNKIIKIENEISYENEYKNKNSINSDYLNHDDNFNKWLIDMRFELEQKESDYNMELKAIKYEYKKEIEKLQKEKEEEIEKAKNQIKILNNKISNLQLESKKRDKEYQEQMQKIMDDYKNSRIEENKEQERIMEEQFNNLKKELEESQKGKMKELEEESKKFELILNEQEKINNEKLKKTIEELDKKYKEKDEEELKKKIEKRQRKEKEKAEKIKEVNELFKNEVENMK